MASSLQVRDGFGEWQEAVVTEVRGEGQDEELRVHFVGWAARWDEWLSNRSERIRFVDAMCLTPAQPRQEDLQWESVQEPEARQDQSVPSPTFTYRLRGATTPPAVRLPRQGLVPLQENPASERSERSQRAWRAVFCASKSLVLLLLVLLAGLAILAARAGLSAIRPQPDPELDSLQYNDDELAAAEATAAEVHDEL
jgi:hypothetical protein